jgi:hypothetical protein
MMPIVDTAEEVDAVDVRADLDEGTADLADATILTVVGLAFP